MKLSLVFGFLFLWAPAQAQNGSDTIKSLVFVGLHVRYGSIVVHTKAVQNISGAKPFGFDFEFSKRKTNYNDWNKSGSFIKTGVLAGYYDFDQSIIGHGAVLTYFIEPAYRINKRITAYYRAGIGLDYLNNPYNLQTNPTNNNYSIHLNPYMHFGGGIGINISKHITIAGEATFHHTSNSEFKQPNKGINWTTYSLGLQYTPSSNFLPSYKRNHNLNRRPRNLFSEIGILLMTPQDYKPKLDAKRTVLAGLTLQFTKPITNSNGITAGAEIYYSHYKKRTAVSIVNVTNPVMAGIHAGHAFLLDKFTFSQQFGFLIVNPTNFILNPYQLYNIGFKVSAKNQLGIGLQANADNADFAFIYFKVRL